jgi:hypothetical protein
MLFSEKEQCSKRTYYADIEVQFQDVEYDFCVAGFQ